MGTVNDRKNKNQSKSAIERLKSKQVN